MIDEKTCERYIGGIWNQKKKDCSLFRVTVDDVQFMAEDSIGRTLDNDELFEARKGIESGLGEGFDIVLDTAIKDAVERTS